MKRRGFLNTILVTLGVTGRINSFAKPLDCYTDQDVEGPFHRAGAPFRVDLATAYYGHGKPLVVSGRVFGSDCITPLSQVQIDIWHASPEGEYDLSSNQFLFRGRMITNDEGAYQFTTLMPKGYRDGPLDRPKHIHYKVTAQGYQPLITQLYFLGDEKLNNDPFVRQNNGMKRALPCQTEPGGSNTMKFDLYLKSL